MNLGSNDKLSFFVNKILKFWFKIVEHKLIDKIAFIDIDSDLSFRIGGINGLASRSRASHEISLDVMLFYRDLLVRCEFGSGSEKLRNED
jgi:hypothetical protein